MKKLFLIIAMIAMNCATKAQTLQSLNRLSGDFNVYYSTGYKARALLIQQRIEKAMKYYESLVKFRPVINVMVLGEEDWNKYTTMSAVYGMPHYAEQDQRLYLAATNNDLWKSFIPPVNALPDDLKKAVIGAYSNDKGELSMQPFFDLLALHELSHAFQFQGGLNIQRKWMGELFANVFLHTYIAENEPGLLSALTVFPQMVIENGSKEFKFTTLQQLEENYMLIATQYPKNYGWFQCRWHAAAAEIYNNGGTATVGMMWSAFRKEKNVFNDEELVRFLEAEKLHDVAAVAINWNSKTDR